MVWPALGRQGMACGSLVPESESVSIEMALRVGKFVVEGQFAGSKEFK